MHKQGIWAMTALLLRRLLKQPKVYLILCLIGCVIDNDIGEARSLYASYQVSVNGFGCFACVTSYSYLLMWMALGFSVLISDVPFLTPMEPFIRMRLTGRASMAARALYLLILSIVYALVIWIMTLLIAGGTLKDPYTWDKALNTMSLGQPVGGAFIYVPRIIISQMTPLLAWAKALVSLIAVLYAVGMMILFLSTVSARKLVICLLGLITVLDDAIGYMMLSNVLYFISPFSWCRLEYQLTAAQYVNRPGAFYCYFVPCIVIIISLFLLLYVSARPKQISRSLNRMEE